ncbi:MAG TPA: hypothetical protein PLP30_00440 [Clostridia bacterium]|nr:hypothetical protein [Clostridia bacterium]HRX42135.1 hypothetical protein [Clostridia bacterium]
MMLIKIGKLTSLLLLIPFLFIFCSCSVIDLDEFNEQVVGAFASRALSAERKYLNEPAVGTVNPFPASFVITGKVLILEENIEYVIPLDEYKKYNFDEYVWYTEVPSEIRYVVLTEMVDEKIVYTIVDLSYDEKVYKGIAGSYKELGEILEELTL